MLQLPQFGLLQDGLALLECTMHDAHLLGPFWSLCEICCSSSPPYSHSERARISCAIRACDCRAPQLILAELRKRCVRPCLGRVCGKVRPLCTSLYSILTLNSTRSLPSSFSRPSTSPSLTLSRIFRTAPTRLFRSCSLAHNTGNRSDHKFDERRYVELDCVQS